MGNTLNRSSVLDRIKEHYALKGNTELARFLGVAPNTVTNWYSRNSFDLDIIYTKCEGVDLNWLFTGNKNTSLNSDKATIVSPVTIIAQNDDFARIPIVDISVAAGTGCYNPDYLEEVECISLPRTMIKDGHTYLCVRIKGQSMTPSLLDGGHLVIRLLDKTEWDGIRDNYVYVVSDNEGRAFVKRLKNRLHQHGFIVCMSDNVDKQNYGNFNLYEEELNTVWFAEWYFTAKIPNIQETYYRKQAELEDKFEDLAQQVRQLTQAINIHN